MFLAALKGFGDKKMNASWVLSAFEEHLKGFMRFSEVFQEVSRSLRGFIEVLGTFLELLRMF